MLIGVERLWSDGRLHAEVGLEIDGRKIAKVRAVGRDTPDAWVACAMPGCFDLQVNGGGGVMLNDDPSEQAIKHIAAAHRARGTGEILPTLITDAPGVMDAAIDAIIAARDTPGVAGLHLEGPHINPERRGTHAERYVRPLDERTMKALSRLREARVPTLLTLAPECNDPQLVQAALEMGVIIALGHSQASAEQARAAIEAGASLVTHLYNAMPPMLSRAPGLAGAAMLSQAYVSVIADGIHVSWDALRIAIAARPRPDRMVLISDAMATVGGDDRFTLYGAEIELQDGKLINSEGALAGAHLDMLTAMRNVHRFAGVPLERAIAMATSQPRALMGLPERNFRSGAILQDFVALDGDLRLLEWPR